MPRQKGKHYFVHKYSEGQRVHYIDRWRYQKKGEIEGLDTEGYIIKGESKVIPYFNIIGLVKGQKTEK